VDYSLYKDVNGLSGESFWDGLFKFLANDGVYISVAIVALLFLVPWPRRALERRAGAVTGTFAAGLALLVAQPIAHLVDRSRPFVDHPANSHLLVHHAKDVGFPSDHATGTFALAMGVWLYDTFTGAVLFVIAALIAFSRVYVGVHYPGDVLGGAVLGIAAALLLHWGPLRRLVERVAGWCSSVWEALLGRVGLRPRPSPSP
jgi:undecaprenyl-diphosphatase